MPPITFQAHLSRRTLLSAGAAGTATLAMSSVSARNDTIRLLVGFAAGGSSDMLARTIAPRLSKALGKSVVVENMPGVSGTLAIQQLQTTGSSAQVFAFYPATTMMGFVLQGQEPDLDKITVISPMYEQFTVFAVNPTVEGFENVKSIQDLIRLARNMPRDIAYATASPGSISHLAFAKLCHLAGIRMQHVAYTGSQPALNDFLAGHVPVAGLDPTVLKAHLTSPKVRPLAINYPKRVKFLPQVPTVAEIGFEELSSMVAWTHFVGPADMPSDAVSKLHAAVQHSIDDNEISQRIMQLNALPKLGSPKNAKDTMVRDLQYWKQLIQMSDIRAI